MVGTCLAVMTTCDCSGVRKCVSQMIRTGSRPPSIRHIREIIKGTLGKVTKAEIIQQCPDISKITIQRTLADLQKSGEILKLSGGRYTAYIWNREKE